MKNYELKICDLKRSLPFIDISEDLAFASFVVISDTELISKVAPLIAKKIGTVDALLTAEAKGIALVYEVSKQLGLKEFIVARKSKKSYMENVVSTSVNSITTKGSQTLFLDGIDAEKIKGKNICLIDDVISTGESINALEKLAQKSGANVVKKAAILAEGEAANRNDIIFLQKLPLFRKEKGEYFEIK
ncbi:MAG: phosphoribosyltransferase family protein [Tissierellia bacterium]|nr:phosphoribosyltransferase family protein [Tissierellia bacterium]